MAEIIYPELCYQMYGICYEIHNAMGSACSERQYQDAFEAKLKTRNVRYEREKELFFDLGDSMVGGNRVDYVIDHKLAIDLKAKKYITRDDFRQMLRYLRSGKFKLGLIVNLGRPKVTIRRVVNSTIRI